MAASPATRCATPKASRAASYTTEWGTTDADETSYQPVLAIFKTAAFMALAISWAAYGDLLTVRAAEWFIAISMVPRGAEAPGP